MPKPNETLRTVAESSGYRRTAYHREVVDFLDRLSRRTDRMRVVSMGRSALGQEIPVAVLSADGAFTPEAARGAGRPVVLVIANIHAGEVEGKEACLMLARDATTGDLGRLVEKAVVLLVPDYNPDGNDRIDPKHRALDLEKLEGQVGPEGGVGTRTTGEGWNLNRDYMKQSAVETRHLAALVAAWMPHVTVDCHTTDGSIHGYELTFDAPRDLASCPAGPGGPSATSTPALYARDRLLRDASKALRARTGFRTYFYGNFRDDQDPTRGWESYPPLPRYGSHYRGLLGCVDVLLEAYSYVDFRTRCDVTYGILVEILDHVRAHADEVRDVVERARTDVAARAADPKADDLVGIAYGVEGRDAKGAVTFAFPGHPLEEVDLEAWDEESQREHRVPGASRRTYRTTFFGRYEPTKTVRRPFAYLLPASETRAIERLAGHRVVLRRLARDVEVEVESYRVTATEPTTSPDVGTHTMTETVFRATPETETYRARPGDVVVPMAQPFANLAIYLLEPESDDGLARWGAFDHVKAGAVLPARRVLRPVELPTRP
jgi:hypothetical protein